MLSMKNPDIMDGAGDRYNALGWAFAIGKGRPSTDYNTPMPIFSASAGAALYRKEYLQKTGLLDELHFAYLEDVDLGYRARILGYRNAYEPTAKVYHAGSATTGSRYNPFKITHSSRNNIYLIYQLHCSEQYIEGSRAVAAAVASLVANHILSGDTRPLLLSPFTNPTLDHVLVERFSAADGAPVTLSQLLIYAENRDIPREWVSGVSVLTRTLPFLFLPKLNYEARVVRHVMTEPSPGTLMPVYLLLPKAAVMMDIQGQKAYIIMDRQAVENLRLAFSRKYINAASVLKLATDAHDFSESIALYNDLFSEKRRCSMIRYQPPFTLFADEKMALQLVRPGAALQSLPALLEHLQMWSAQAPDLYFCEEGLLQFVRTGKMFDIPPDLCDAPDIPTRRELLLRLRRAAESDHRTLRIVDPAQLALTPSMCVNVFQGRGVVFCQAIQEPDGQYCREYLMQDPILTEALLTYLDDGHASDWLRSQKYTLDFIDYCLRLL